MGYLKNEPLSHAACTLVLDLRNFLINLEVIFVFLLLIFLLLF